MANAINVHLTKLLVPKEINVLIQYVEPTRSFKKMVLVRTAHNTSEELNTESNKMESLEDQNVLNALVIPDSVDNTACQLVNAIHVVTSLFLLKMEEIAKDQIVHKK